MNIEYRLYPYPVLTYFSDDYINILVEKIKKEIEVNGIYTYNKYTVKILIFWSVNERRR